MIDTFRISGVAHASYLLGTNLQKAKEWKVLNEPFDPYWPGPFHFTDGTFGIRVPSPHGKECLRVQKVDEEGRMTIHDLMISCLNPARAWSFSEGKKLFHCVCALFVAHDGEEFSQSDIAPATGFSNIPTEDLTVLTAMPFDPDADAPVQTADGRDVQILAKGLKTPAFPIAAVITNDDGAQSVVSYLNDGTTGISSQTHLTLVNMVRVPRSNVLLALDSDGCPMFITYPSMRERNEADGYRVIEFAPVPK